VKRAPRQDSDADAPATNMPRGDLLASLSSAASGLGGTGLAPPNSPQARRGPDGHDPATPPGPPVAPPLPGRRGTPGDGRVDQGPQPPRPAGPTESGLARRVRGAQLPSTEPLSLRRSADHPPANGGGYGRDDRGANGHDPVGRTRPGNGNGHGGADKRHDDSAAKDVYSFLTSFTAGVQRGLDEAGRHPTLPEENG
jgi:hypothetical protein